MRVGINMILSPYGTDCTGRSFDFVLASVNEFSQERRYAGANDPLALLFLIRWVSARRMRTSEIEASGKWREIHATLIT